LIRAFTGPSRLTEGQVEWCEEAINELPDRPTEVRTGCADGLDTIAAGLQWHEYPDIKHLLIVPSAYHNSKFVSYLGAKDGVEVIRCPRKTQRAAAYRTRNRIMVCGSYEGELPDGQNLYRADVLEAFLFQEDFYRSGEWMTVNLALNFGNVVVNKHIIPRDL
jgi:hypothetical protein